MRAWWNRLLEVRHPDHRVRRRARVLITVCALTIAVMPPIGVLLALTIDAWLLSWGILLVLAAAYAGALAAARRGRTVLAVCVLLAFFYLAVLGGAVVEGHAATHPVFTTLFVLLAGVALPPRALLPVLGCSAVATWALPLAVGGRTDGSSYEDLLVFTSIVAAYAALIAVVNNKVVDRSFASADAQRRRAEDLAAALRGANADLERRVAERTTALSAALRRYEALAEQLAELSAHDHLTGLANRRRLDAEVDRLHGSAGRGDVSLAVVDLDDFKRINDTHGHHVGDVVLQRTAAALRRHRRHGDVAARLGGEEFVLLLPDTSSAEAAAACERLRAEVAALDLDDVVPGLRVTLSAGVVTTAVWRGRDDLLRRADELLYAAKRAGKDRVVAGVLEDAPPAATPAAPLSGAVREDAPLPGR